MYIYIDSTFTLLNSSDTFPSCMAKREKGAFSPITAVYTFFAYMEAEMEAHALESFRSTLA